MRQQITTINDLSIIEELKNYLSFLNEAFGYDAYTISDDNNSILFEGDDVTAEVINQFIA